MRIPFRKIKDLASLPLHGLMTLARWLPECVMRGIFRGVGALGKAAYFVPGNHMRRTSINLAKVSGRNDPRRIYFDLVDKLVLLLNLYAQLMRHGGEPVARSFRLDPDAARIIDDLRARHGKAIMVVPHCVGSVLAAAGFGNLYPSIVLLRESRNAKRSSIMKTYFEKLGPHMFYARRTDRTVLARGILQALKEDKFVVGTTDLIRRQPDSVEVRVFGQPVWVDGWPVRFSVRRNVPILPAYVGITKEGITFYAGEPYMADENEVASSQKWADYFETNFKRRPSDWVFQFDKRWAAVLAAAAG